jgi:aspartyl-tRNA(Asn)/glutamyl-tRNA(Gln) amidotransferase subunit B
MKYSIMIGLEVHVQLNTKTKLFSSASTTESEPNRNVSSIEIGIPGALPQLNSKVVDKAIKTGLALCCKINNYSTFDRKHYFYPDLPLGYQITQFYNPICKDGYIETDLEKIRINRIHIETDAGKMIHGKSNSLLDFNRCGIPLLEIVTEPDITSVDSLSLFLIELIQILKCIETSNCSMDKGNIRADVNISIADEKKRYPRVEIKNVNSVNFIRKAAEIEIKRQIKCIELGSNYSQHTRRYDSDSNTTIFMRSKENELDYRYLPDFNIPSLNVSTERISLIKLPELPKDKKRRYSEFIKNKEILEVVASEKTLSQYFEQVIPLVKNPELAANYIAGDLSSMNKLSRDPKDFSKIINMLTDGKISTKVARYLISRDEDPIKLVEKEDLLQISDIEIIKKIVLEVIDENPKEVEKYQKGKTNLLQFFIGKCISKTQGRCNVNLLDEILKNALEN